MVYCGLQSAAKAMTLHQCMRVPEFDYLLSKYLQAPSKLYELILIRFAAFDQLIP